MENKNYLKYHLYSGILIAFGIAIVIKSLNHMVLNVWYISGIFIGGIFIGVGLLPFQINKERFK